MLRSIRYGEADRVVHLYSRDAGADRGDREGVAAAEVAVRGAARAVLPARPRALRGAGRPAHGDRRLDRRRPRAAALVRAGAGGGGAGLRRGAAAARLGGAEPGRLQPALQLPGAAGRRSPEARQRAGRTALAFRLKLALAAGFSPELASCATLRRGRAHRGLLRRGRGRGLRELRGGRLPAHARRRTGSWSRRWRRPLAEAPAAGRAWPRQAERAITETLEHHAHVQLRAAA